MKNPQISESSMNPWTIGKCLDNPGIPWRVGKYVIIALEASPFSNTNTFPLLYHYNTIQTNKKTNKQKSSFNNKHLIAKKWI